VNGVRISFIDDVGNSEVSDFPLKGADSRFRSIGIAYGEVNPLLSSFPTSGGQRTYIINNKYSKAEIAPLSESGDVCGVTDIIEFSPCDSDVVF